MYGLKMDWSIQCCVVPRRDVVYNSEGRHKTSWTAVNRNCIYRPLSISSLETDRLGNSGGGARYRAPTSSVMHWSHDYSNRTTQPTLTVDTTYDDKTHYFLRGAVHHMIWWTILTCAQKLTCSQLSLPHGNQTKKNNEGTHTELITENTQIEAGPQILKPGLEYVPGRGLLACRVCILQGVIAIRPKMTTNVNVARIIQNKLECKLQTTLNA